jgi:hypothetical protein
MRKKLAALISAAATVTMITGAGVASATAGQRARAHPAVTGTEHVQIVGTSLSGKRNKVVAYGVFNASGIDQPVSRSQDIFTFPDGSFTVTHKPTSTQQHFSKATCSATVVQQGNYTLSGGTDAYEGISGHGTFTVHVLIVFSHTETGCSTKPIASQTLVQAQGPVTLP